MLKGKPHMPTLAYVLVAVVVLFVLYHIGTRKGK